MWFLKTATLHDVVYKNHITPRWLTTQTTSLLLCCWCKTTSLLEILGGYHITPRNLKGKPRHSYISSGQTTTLGHTKLLLQIFGANHSQNFLDIFDAQGFPTFGWDCWAILSTTWWNYPTNLMESHPVVFFHQSVEAFSAESFDTLIRKWCLWCVFMGYLTICVCMGYLTM